MSSESPQPAASVIKNVLSQDGIGTSQAKANLNPTHKSMAIGVRGSSSISRKATKYMAQNYCYGPPPQESLATSPQS